MSKINYDEVIEMTAEEMQKQFENSGMQKANLKIIFSVVEQLDSVIDDDDKFNEFIHVMIFLNMAILTRMSEEDGMHYVNAIATRLQTVADFDRLVEHEGTMQ